MSNNRAVLWDLDGTLIDSTEYHWAAWRETVLNEGYELSREKFISCFGQRSETAVYTYCHKDLSLAEAQRIVEAKQKRYREIIRTQGIVLYPGANDLLNSLKNTGWQQALATSASAEDVDTILTVLNLGYFFDICVSAESVRESKPNPEIFLLAANRLNLPAEKCIVVEDSAVGVEAGQRAGMKTIGVLSSHKNLSADLTVENLTQLSLSTFKELLDK